MHGQWTNDPTRRGCRRRPLRAPKRRPDPLTLMPLTVMPLTVTPMSLTPLTLTPLTVTPTAVLLPGAAQ